VNKPFYFVIAFTTHHTISDFARLPSPGARPPRLGLAMPGAAEATGGQGLRILEAAYY